MTRVTDHAVLRYLQRVHGVDVELVRETIGAAVAHALPGTTHVHAGGLRFVMRGGQVVTVCWNEGEQG
jgi:hypothetical protein